MSAPHTGQEAAELQDFRLSGGILKDCHAFCPHGKQHYIFRGSYAGKRKADMGSLRTAADSPQALRLFPELRSHPAQGFQMQIDGPFSYDAAPRIGEEGLSHSGQKASQQHNGRTHDAGVILRRPAGMKRLRVYNQPGPLPADPAAITFENFQHGSHVRDIRAVINHSGSRALQSSGENRKHRIF